MSTPSYRRHLETLVALVTHLASHNLGRRTPPGLADALSIDEKEITTVLEGFKSLFRRGKGKAKNNAPLFALQLRYARQWMKTDTEAEDEAQPPLEPEYLVMLLNFIIDRANAEARDRQAFWTLIASIVAAVASVLVLWVTVSN